MISKCKNVSFLTASIVKWSSPLNPHSGRTFVSQEFKLEEHWSNRLNSSCFKKLTSNNNNDPSIFFYAIDKKYSAEKRFNPVDVDLFANLASVDIPQLEEVLHKHRRTPQTWLTLPSTHHGVVRTYLDIKDFDSLTRVLNDPLNYGVFPDGFALILALDAMMENRDYGNAVKVANYLTLQESYDREPVLNELALWATYAYLKSGAEIAGERVKNDEQDDDDDEEIKIALQYLPNDYHDDHFDLDEAKLAGKSLCKFANKIQDENLALALKMLGLTVWGKHEEVAAIVDNNEGFAVPDEILNLIKEKNPDFKAEVKNREMDVEAELKRNFLSAYKSDEKSLIEKQIEIYSEWNLNREKELERQNDLYSRAHRRAEVEAKKAELLKEEEKLFFFQNVEKFEEIKQKKQEDWERQLPRVTWGKRVTLKPVKTK